MAYIVDRVGKARGKNKKPEISYQVKWNFGNKVANGRGSETFHDHKNAEYFKAQVERAGGQYPPNFLPGGGDDGWCDDETYRRFLGAQSEPEKPPVPVFRDYAETVIKSLSGIQGSTRARYRRIVEGHINPWFGDAAMDDVKAISKTTVGTWVNDLGDGAPTPAGDPHGKLKPKTIRNVHGLLYSIVQHAVEEEPPLRNSNPCEKTRLPKLDDGEGEEEMVFLTHGEWETIFALLQDDAKDLAEFLATTGLRYAEATALQVRDLDLLAPQPRLSVRRAWKRQEDGSWDYGPPKTPKSKRRISLSPAQVTLLLPLVAGKRTKDLVFLGPTGGRWVHQTFYMKRWRPAVYAAIRCAYHREQDRAAGIGVDRLNTFVKNEDMDPCGCPGMLEKVPRIHDLRHTHVSWLIARNMPMKAIQLRLGHESAQTTSDRYGHLLPEVDDQMVAIVDSFMIRGREPVLAA